VALARPAEDAPAPLVYGLPYGALGYNGYNGYALPYAAPVAYAHAPFVYNALDTGLVYPVAEAYVHDVAGGHSYHPPHHNIGCTIKNKTYTSRS